MSKPPIQGVAHRSRELRIPLLCAGGGGWCALGGCCALEAGDEVCADEGDAGCWLPRVGGAVSNDLRTSSGICTGRRAAPQPQEGSNSAEP